MSNQTLVEKRAEVLAKSFVGGKPAFVASGKGAMFTDVDGREYIDFAGGIAVMNVGHSHPKVVAAIKDQAEKFTHTCFMVIPYEGAVRLGERLCALTPGSFPKKAFFANSGAEAVENAVKISRYYTKKTGIIVFDNAFHGRTLLTMTMTHKAKPYKFGFGPFASEIYRMPYAYCYRCPFGLKYPECKIQCAEYLKNEMFVECPPETTAALIAEPVQGEGGFIAPPPEYFPRIAEICKENGILFVSDEIQAGICRTGNKIFAIEHWGVDPDLMTIAKSLGAGIPLSAVVGRAEIMDSVHPGGIGGTYGANPVACAAANAVLDIIEEDNLPEKSEALGKKLWASFEEMKEKYVVIGDVRGKGPMIAMELVKDRETKEPDAAAAAAVAGYAFEKGLILLTCGPYGNVIRCLMPLVITDEQLDKGLSIMNDAFASLEK
ncbi:MAG TPA: 4-aminobutyrate--2-oxoglutarate transaminase [Syntrophales bacterium]|nr:4-aminobutyrate--2-oxoglutarate transaminase [Syntrophales bacterium]HPQ45565.1 4-aminobutyrate--2-oxoglutarate transaminase [Syntrophales bacterium]